MIVRDLGEIKWHQLMRGEAVASVLSRFPRQTYADLFAESSTTASAVVSNDKAVFASRRALRGYAIRQIDRRGTTKFEYAPVRQSDTLDDDAEVPLAWLKTIKARINGILNSQPLIENVTVHIDRIRREVVIGASSGLLERREEKRIELRAVVTYSADATGSVSLRTEGWHDGNIADVMQQALARADSSMEAVRIDPGTYDLVVSAGCTGMLIHELFGHALESDVAYGGSEILAPPCVTVMDRGPQGIEVVDDEGIRHGPVLLIDRGRHVQVMTDQAAAGIGRRSTGNGRRQDYRHLPLPRMWETFMTPGDADADEIVRSTLRGIFVEEFDAGYTCTDEDRMILKITHGRRIENGRLGPAVCPLVLVGNRRSLAMSITHVGRDLRFDSRATYCGKHGQWIPVGMGQPTIKLRSVNLGYL